MSDDEERITSLRCLAKEYELIPFFELDAVDEKITKAYMNLSYSNPERIKDYRRLFIFHLVLGCIQGKKPPTSNPAYELNMMQTVKWMSAAHGPRWFAHILPLTGLLYHFTIAKKPLHVAGVWYRINRLRMPTPAETKMFPQFTGVLDKMRTIRLWRTATRLVDDTNFDKLDDFLVRHDQEDPINCRLLATMWAPWKHKRLVYETFIKECQRSTDENLNKIGRSCGWNANASRKAQQGLITSIVDKLAPKEDLLWNPGTFKLPCSNPTCHRVETTSQEFKLCGGCRLAKYCSKKCQRLDRPVHRHQCKPLFE